MLEVLGEQKKDVKTSLCFDFAMDYLRILNAITQDKVESDC
jgi:hypothetical protein